MKRYWIVSLLLIGLAGSVPAQQPAAPVPQDTLPPAGLQAAVVPAAHQDCAPSCAQACAPQLKTICVGEHATKVTVKPMYSKESEPLCLPRCSLFGFSRSCAESCLSCEHPRTKHY